MMLVYLSHTDVNNKNKYHPVGITVTCWREAASVATAVEQVILLRCIKRQEKIENDKIKY